MARQATIEALRTLLPLPADEKEAAQLAKQVLGSMQQMDAKRGRFLELLGELRHRSAAVVTAVGHWRTCLRRAQHHFISLPDEEMPFWHNNCAYPARLVADLDFLPAPCASDPLLLSWFGKQLPWIFANLPKAAGLPLASVTLALVADAAAARAPSYVGGVSYADAGADLSSASRQREILRETQKLERAQRAILKEAHMANLVPSDERLLKEATRKAGARGEWTPERWQWSALQSLIYGEPTYFLRLLKGLPACREGLEMIQAATTVQRHYRRRYHAKFARITEDALMMQAAQEAADLLRRRHVAAGRVQAIARGRATRMAFNDIAQGIRDERSQTRERAAAQIRSANAAKERRREEDGAARVIQRRGRVVKAKRDVRHSKAVQQAQMASAGSLLSQVHGVATLAKILSRYRQSRHIMWSVYRHSVLAWYEQTAAQYIADHVAASQAAAAAPGTEGTPAALVRSATSRRRLNAKAVRAPIRMSERTLPPLDVAHLLSRQRLGGGSSSGRRPSSAAFLPM